MDSDPRRRDFLRTIPAAAGVLASIGRTPAAADPRIKLEPFDYQGVQLLPSRWQQQVEGARAFYLGLPDDDVLLGFRAAAGLAAPGRPLEGWARSTAGGVFGQWLSGMARLYRATGEPSWRDRAALWMREWSKTVKSDGDCRMGHYAWEKVVCGLVD